MEIWRVVNGKWNKKVFCFKRRRVNKFFLYTQNTLNELVFNELLKNTGMRYIVFNSAEEAHFATYSEVFITKEGDRKFKGRKFLEAVLSTLKDGCRKGFSIILIQEDLVLANDINKTRLAIVISK